MSPGELPPRFAPGPLEARWQARWRDEQLFRAPEDPTGPAFSIALPPPNVTGVLTLGHMLGDTVQDLLARWHRMRGAATLWLPGVDHAGLATQVEVGKRLAREGVRIETLPPEELLARVEAWKEEHERRILEQMRAAGFSTDDSRYRYTMDDGFRRATRRVFVWLYREGLIYRGDRIVNWDPRLRTAVSDLEVVHTEERTTLRYVRYPWADGAPGGIEVATVRPETIFGDVAVAVHPSDPRHAGAIGRSVRVPLTDRVVPVIPDDLVDPTFGNGALKVTPRHDPVDFQIARRHPELERPPSILDDRGHLDGPWVPPPFRGTDRAVAREAVTAELRGQGLLVREEPHVHSVGRSERSDAVIEPMLSRQWFVRMAPLAGPAVAAVRSGEIRLHPERWELTFFRWMERLEDWCISRQVRWGHPIPVLYCSRCSAEIVDEEPPPACPSCGGTELAADPDVLDTWFSSWLWPFVTLGWPEDSADLRRYYPTSVLVTGRDIMFFWVARMMMAGYHFTGRPPFRDVYFTGMLRDEQGRRMQKHLGNSPDPAEVVRRWGADALRVALLFPNPTDQDGTFGEATLESARNFLTKCWNLGRLLASHLPDGAAPAERPPVLGPDAPLEERWILARWRRTAAAFDAALERFEFTQATGLLREFLWHDLADRFVEIAKEALQGRRGELAARRARATFLFVFERSLRLLHPIAPHMTEELWQALPHDGSTLERAAWPDPTAAPEDPEAEVEMETVLDAIRRLRLLRSENDVPAVATPTAWVRPANSELAELLRRESGTVVRLARIDRLELLEGSAAVPADTVTQVAPLGELFLHRAGESPSANREGLLREREKLQLLLLRAETRLHDAGFVAHAPPEVVSTARSKAEELRERIARLDDHLRSAAGEGT